MYTDKIEMKCKPFYSMHFHKSIPGFFHECLRNISKLTYIWSILMKITFLCKAFEYIELKRVKSGNS